MLQKTGVKRHFSSNKKIRKFKGFEFPRELDVLLEVIRMATKSILKDVKIRDKQLANTFVAALCQAENSKYKPAPLTRECNELTGDKIKEFFGKNI